MSSYLCEDVYMGDDELDGIFGRNNIFRRFGRSIDLTNPAVRKAARTTIARFDPTDPHAKYGNVTKGILIAGALVGGAALAAWAAGGSSAAIGAAAASGAAGAAITGVPIMFKKPVSRTDGGTIDDTKWDPNKPPPKGYVLDKDGNLVKKKVNLVIPALAGGAVLTTAFFLLH